MNFIFIQWPASNNLAVVLSANENGTLNGVWMVPGTWNGEDWD